VKPRFCAALFFFAAFFCFSCSFFRPQPSILTLGYGDSPRTLFALNKNARSSAIAADGTSGYLYYRFDEDFLSALQSAPLRVPALELEFKAASDESSEAVFFFGFLFEDDFENSRRPRLKKTLDARTLARGSQSVMRNGACTISLAFPPKSQQNAPLGFMCYASFPVSVTTAKIVEAEIFSDANSARFAFSMRGGSSVLTTRAQGSLSPLAADPLFLVAGGKESWRAKDYELYAWEKFPSILFFDTKDYAVQDGFFKRLAFFAEKKGFRGKLASDEYLAGQHGFNALDFRAATLAEFFSLARATGFALNAREELLCDILIANGIIVETQEGFAEGEGAVISISQESPQYLRRQLIVHEGLHALFFLHEDFRVEVERVYNETDPLCVRFLESYFDITPTLAYDITDRYLILNEFMAYLLQQPVSAVSQYFYDRIANYVYINRFEPALCQYVRDTRARGFVEAAQKLSAYLERVWGFEAGRLWDKPL
jgi:hypothetical protein